MSAPATLPERLIVRGIHRIGAAPDIKVSPEYDSFDGLGRIYDAVGNEDGVLAAALVSRYNSHAALVAACEALVTAAGLVSGSSAEARRAIELGRSALAAARK